MARPYTYHSFCHNPLPNGEDKLAEGLPGVFTKSSNTPTPSPTVFWAPTPAFALAPTPALPSINKLFKQFMKAYLETNQRPNQPPAECKRPLKSKVPDVYYGKLHMDCYHFCQQYKDYFETSWATRTNSIFFAAFFL